MVDLFGSGNLKQGMRLVYLLQVGLEESASYTAPKHSRDKGSTCKDIDLRVLGAYRTEG